MPADWLVYWITRPLGLVLVALAVLLPFWLWRALLEDTHSSVGSKPLVFGYLAAGVGLAVLVFASSYFEFSHRVAQGNLAESQRWSIVPGWSLYLGALSLLIALPLLGLVGVPLSALLLRWRRLTIKIIITLVLATWFSLAALFWALPSNEWQRTHQLEAFTMALSELAPGIVLVALPFLLAIHCASRSFRRPET